MAVESVSAAGLDDSIDWWVNQSINQSNLWYSDNQLGGRRSLVNHRLDQHVHEDTVTRMRSLQTVLRHGSRGMLRHSRQYVRVLAPVWLLNPLVQQDSMIRSIGESINPSINQTHNIQTTYSFGLRSLVNRRTYCCQWNRAPRQKIPM